MAGIHGLYVSNSVRVESVDLAFAPNLLYPLGQRARGCPSESGPSRRWLAQYQAWSSHSSSKSYLLPAGGPRTPSRWRH